MEHQFKPFERVLVRDNDTSAWRGGLFSHIETWSGNRKVYCASGNFWTYCIPYAGNEHLLGTADSPKMIREEPKKGDVFLHFKGKYYYVLMLAHHSETDGIMVVYQALYGVNKICCRPLNMFMSEVDHEKYPDVAQKWRFELVGNLP